MIVKLLTAAIAIALTLLIVRKLAALAERVRVGVKTERRRQERSVTLRQDPDSGVLAAGEVRRPKIGCGFLR